MQKMPKVAWLLGILSILGMEGPLAKKEAPLIKEPSAVLKLVRIKALKTQEKGGDELYLAVTAYPSQGKPTHYQIPPYPSYWKSSYLEKLQNVEIWKDAIEPGSSISLSIALSERDTPPFDNDDFFGEIKVKLEHDGKEVRANWEIPEDLQINEDLKDGTAKHNKVFSFQDSEFSYELELSFQSLFHKSSQMPAIPEEGPKTD